MDILPAATFARSEGFALFGLTKRYRPLARGVVAMAWPLGFLIVHMPFRKLTEQSASSSRLTEIRVNAILGANTAFFSNAGVRLDPFGSSMRTSPMPTTALSER